MYDHTEQLIPARTHLQYIGIACARHGVTAKGPRCPLKSQCKPADYRRIRRWEHEVVLEAKQRWLDRRPDVMTLRRRTVEHVFGTLKHWMGPTHFLTRRPGHVATEMSLQMLAYNLKRVIRILGFAKAMRAIKVAGA
jgi:hypothetical protein